MGLQESGANKYPDQLSGGMQQRVAIGQALRLIFELAVPDSASTASGYSRREEIESMTSLIEDSMGGGWKRDG